MTIISLVDMLNVLQQQFPTFYQLLDLLTKSVFIVLLALPLQFLFRKQSASALSVFWLAVIVSLLLLPLFSKIVPEIPLSISITQDFSVTTSEVPAKIPEGERNPAHFLSSQPDLLAIVQFFYLGIAALMIGYLACGIVRMFYISQLARPHHDLRAVRILDHLKSINGVNCQIKLLTSPGVASPVTWGIWRHRIIFPDTTNAWNEELLTHVIGHELGHIHRKDWISFILARLTICLYWPNPLVWLAQKNMVLEAEKACDDTAADIGKGPFSYAENLVRVANAMRKGRQSLTPAMYGSSSQLMLRVKHSLNTEKPRGYFDFADILPSIFLVAVIAAPVSALSLEFRIEERIQPGSTKLIPLHFFDELDSDEFTLDESDEKLPALPEIVPGDFVDVTTNTTASIAPITVSGVSKSLELPAESLSSYHLVNTSLVLTNNAYQSFADAKPLLISNPQPQYPAQAKSRGIEGYVVAEYSISQAGKATHIKIIESVPTQTFDRSVTRAINQYSYHPALATDQAKAENVIRRKFVFSLAQEI